MVNKKNKQTKNQETLRGGGIFFRIPSSLRFIVSLIKHGIAILEYRFPLAGAGLCQGSKNPMLCHQ